MKSICVLGIFVVDLCFMGNRIPSKGQTILGKNISMDLEAKDLIKL